MDATHGARGGARPEGQPAGTFAAALDTGRRRDREMLDYEDGVNEGSNVRWLVAAALIALGMTLVAMRYEDGPSARNPVSATFGAAAGAAAP